MKKNFSIFLELLRVASAFGVVIGHAHNEILFWLPAYFVSPTECVAVFFVLSGFLIRFVTREKEDTWRPYVVARVSRIIPVAILALACTLVFDHIGKLYHYASYAAFPWINQHTDLLDLVSCLTFTNEIWNRHSVVGTDEPFWSLGFEVCYYVFFGLVLYASRRWRPWLLAGWVLLVGPKVLLYLPLWLLGVACYEGLVRWHHRGTAAIWLGRFICASGILVLSLFRFVLMKGAPGPYHWDSLRQIRWSFAYAMAIGFGISLVLAGFEVACPRESFWPRWFECLVRWLAGGTFTLYLLHQPLIHLLIALFPRAYSSYLASSLVVVVAILSCYLLAEVAERRKRLAARIFGRLLSRFSHIDVASVTPTAAQ